MGNLKQTYIEFKLDNMPGAGRAEFYLIAGAMFVILVISFSAVYFFVKTYKKEKAERIERELTKKAAKEKEQTEESPIAGDEAGDHLSE